MKAITDQNCIITLRDAEGIECLLNDLRFCSDLSIERRAGDNIKILFNFKHMQNFPDENSRFGGCDRDFLSSVMQSDEKFRNAVEKDIFRPANGPKAFAIGRDSCFRLLIVHIVAAAEFIIQRRADKMLEG